MCRGTPARVQRASMTLAAVEVVGMWPQISLVQPLYRAGWVGWSAGTIQGSSGGEDKDPGHYTLEAQIQEKGAYVRLGGLLRVFSKLALSAEVERSFVRMRVTGATVKYREQTVESGEMEFAPFGGNAFFAGLALTL